MLRQTSHALRLPVLALTTASHALFRLLTWLLLSVAKFASWVPVCWKHSSSRCPGTKEKLAIFVLICAFLFATGWGDSSTSSSGALTAGTRVLSGLVEVVCDWCDISAISAGSGEWSRCAHGIEERCSGEFCAFIRMVARFGDMCADRCMSLKPSTDGVGAGI